MPAARHLDRHKALAQIEHERVGESALLVALGVVVAVAAAPDHPEHERQALGLGLFDAALHVLAPADALLGGRRRSEKQSGDDENEATHGYSPWPRPRLATVS